MIPRTRLNCTSAAVALFGLVVLTLPSAASYLWEPRTQVTHTVDGAIVKNLELGATGSPFLHLVVRRFASDTIHTWGTGYYLSVDQSEDWESEWDDAWSEAHRFTFDDNPVHDQSDFNMVVDRNDNAHVVYEGLNYPEITPGFVAYKRSDDQTVWDGDSLPEVALLTGLAGL
jgi:hypothetical protein